MELRDYLRIMYANWVLILGTTILGVVVAAAFSFMATPQYEAQTKVYVSVQTDTQASGDLLQGSNFARQNMATFAELATTESVLEPVAEELELDRTYAELANQITASVPADSTLLNITASDENPELAAQLADETGTQLKTLVEEELESTDSDEGPSAVQINTVQTASTPSTPVSPRTTVNVLLGLLLGFAVGLGIAILRHVLDTRIRTLEDIRETTDAPILGRIVDDPDAQKKPLIAHLDPKHPRAEAVRSLRTNLQFLGIDEETKSFVISSSGPAEGKSTTAANLALTLAETGLRTALVDCDLRRPRISSYMGIEGAVGLTDVLVDRVELSDVLQKWGRSELYVLPAGQVPPNPSELLGSDAMDRTLDVLSKSMDIVIIDSPPLPVVTDAAVVGAKTEGVILVAAAGKTHQHNFEAAVESLETAHVPLRGVVATMLPTKGPGGYGYAQYAYTYEDLDQSESPDMSEPRRKPSGRRAQRGVR